MIEYPNTEDGENWSVFLFDCAKDKVGELIVSLFKTAKQIVSNCLPNYTMRYWDKNSIKISFRVLRDKHERKVVQKLENSIAEILKKEGISPIVNPKGEDQRVSGWSSGAPLKKCKAYSRLGEFVVQLAEEGLFNAKDRNEMRHLAINMLFMREATKYYDPFAYFWDTITDKPLPQPYPFYLVTRQRINTGEVLKGGTL